jgi:hypothetical protein
MDNKFFAYSNGWGHVVVTMFFGILGALLILFPTADATSHGIGITLITTASGAWFIPGAAKQVATEVQKVTSRALPGTPDKPPPTSE